jgi:alpha-L-fucosidase
MCSLQNKQGTVEMPKVIWRRLALTVFITCTACSSQAREGPAREVSVDMPLPRPCQLAWQQAEFGVLVCYELHAFGPGRYRQGRARVTPITDVNQFNPTRLDTDQWIRAVRDAGAHFAILTASHESGFRLWQSEVNPYCLKAVTWGQGKRDLVREFATSCRKYGIKPGIYLGTRWNAQLGVYDFKVTERSRISQAAYNRLIEREVEEICTRYGNWFEFWFDGGAHGPDQGGPDVLSLVETHQPQAVFYHNLQRADARWGGSESGTVPYPCWATFPYRSTGAGESAAKEISKNGFALLKHGDPNGAYWMPAMSDAPLRGHGGHEWFWEPDDEHLIYPLDKLVDMYDRSVGHNSTLILGIAPDTKGLLPEADVRRLQALGQEIRRTFSNPIGATTGSGYEIEFRFNDDTEFDTVVIQEDIQYGERVRAYDLQILRDGAWHPLATGTCIGHKRIHRLPRARAQAMSLIVHQAIGRPLIKQLAIYLAKGNIQDAKRD